MQLEQPPMLVNTAFFSDFCDCKVCGRFCKVRLSTTQKENEGHSLLKEEGYAYLPIRDEAELIANLRTQLAALNDYDFTDAEWERFFKTSIAPASDGIVEKTRRIQTDYIQNLKRDDGITKNIRLIDKKHIHNNRLQVINQVSRFRPITFYDREEQEDGHHLVSLYQMGVWS